MSKPHIPAPAPSETIGPNATTFEKELAALINRFSCENVSNTPDFILASYLTACLRAFNDTSTEREKWYGKSLHI